MQTEPTPAPEREVCGARWTWKVQFANHARHQCNRDDEHEQHICRCGAFHFEGVG